ncbi:MAG: hypothetical protein F6K09_11610 [Merismopedia sp. SIO2A8]|nr:hypothetical protein [Merismopedia sp. SIO2A8]
MWIHYGHKGEGALLEGTYCQSACQDAYHRPRLLSENATVWMNWKTVFKATQLLGGCIGNVLDDIDGVGEARSQ